MPKLVLYLEMSLYVMNTYVSKWDGVCPRLLEEEELHMPYLAQQSTKLLA